MLSKLFGEDWRKGSSVCVSAKKQKKTLSHLATCSESFGVTLRIHFVWTKKQTEMSLCVMVEVCVVLIKCPYPDLL